MQSPKRPWNLFASAALLVGLVAVLIANLVIVIDLPSQVYTADQLAYLDYNRTRSISQAAPLWNTITAEGAIQPSILSHVRENRVRASLLARFEEHDGVNVTVYDLDFRGDYHLAYDGLSNPVSRAGTTVQLFFPFPSNLETLHDVRLLVDGEEPPDVQYSTEGITWHTVLQAGEERRVHISYKADGANSFAYGLQHGQRSDVDVVITVVGLAGSTVPRSALPATQVEASDDGEVLSWEYADLIVDRDVQLTLPTHLSFAQRIAALQKDFSVLAGLAPILVGLFLLSLAVVFRLGRIQMGVANLLLAGCGMALFFPLLIFLSGIVDLIPAAIMALLLVSGLLLAFLGFATGSSGVRWRAGLLVIIFLGFFSLGMLTPWPGLMLTCGGLLLVGTFMLLSARRPPGPAPEPAPPPPAPAGALSDPDPAPPPDESTAEGLSIVLADEMVPELEPVQLSEEPAPGQAEFYCPHCARALADDYGFCPGCGQDTSPFRRCNSCGVRQFVPEDREPAHCLYCGHSLV
ncbi:hypothetical protein ACFLWA_04725 [Chloroflexota bacterium]